MGEERRKAVSRGTPEALREAVERTFAATAGPAAEGRDRARELLDEVARRGQAAVDASGEFARRGRDAAEAVAKRLK